MTFRNCCIYAHYLSHNDPPRRVALQYAMLDLDLREMDILMQMNAFEAAGDIYLYGKHSYMFGTNGTSLSLAQVAKASERTSIPLFSSFSMYYESDRFADKLIQGAITRSDEIFSESDRRAIVLRASQVMVAYFGAISAMQDASSDCKANMGSTQAWDTAAALMIGSLEGVANGGSFKEGYLLFDLAQEQCREFGTCTQNETAISNENLVTFLYAGRGEAKSKSCEALDNMRGRVSSTLLVPMIQATISASMRLSKKNYKRGDAVEGFVFSSALLPIVAALDRSAADAIQEALDLNQDDRRPMDKTIIFAAFSRVYEELGINCRHIGKAEGVDACDKFDLDALRKKKKRKGAILEGDVSQSALGGITVALVILVALVFIIRLEVKKNGRYHPAKKRKRPGFFRRFNISRNRSNSNKEKSSLGKTYLSRGHFWASSALLSSEAMRLTSSVRFSENRQGGDEDDSETTWVISNTDGREPADIACC
jgi:hypothetical protein